MTSVNDSSIHLPNHEENSLHIEAEGSVERALVYLETNFPLIEGGKVEMIITDTKSPDEFYMLPPRNKGVLSIKQKYKILRGWLGFSMYYFLKIRVGVLEPPVYRAVWYDGAV